MDNRDDKAHERFGLSILLFLLTCGTTTWVGGLAFSVPLMAILLAHELGHYIAARIHRVPSSPPYFIPLPIGPLGTLGAVIAMPDRIAKRDALLDIGAAGPLAGMVVAVPVLIYGISESPVGPAGQSAPTYLQEGHSLLYMALLYWIKGPFPAGHDILLTPTAFAGWVGLLVTMINLIPAAQLDGGHVAYALLGQRQERFSARVRALLLPIGLVVSAYYGLPAYRVGARGAELFAAASAGLPWLLWFALLAVMVSRTGVEHPRVDDGPLSPRRRLVAAGTLLLFVLLFMPSWLRTVVN